MSKKPKFSRRTMLSLTAAGLIGSGSAIAAQSSSDDVALADYDPDATVDWGTDAWPQVGYDNGGTQYNPHVDAPTGELSPAWTFGEDVDISTMVNHYGYRYPIAANSIIYTLSERSWRDEETEQLHAIQTLHALNEEDGTKQWSAELEIATRGTVEGGLPVGEFGFGGLAVADGIVYASRWGRTTSFDAETGERLWTVEHGGDQIAVTDESLVVSHQISPDNNLTTPPEGQRLLTLSRVDGSIQWEHEFRGGGSIVDGDVNLYTAVVGESVYAAYQSYEEIQMVYSLSLDGGEVEWESEQKRLGGIVATDSELCIERGDGITVLDTTTGEEKWSKKTKTLDTHESEEPQEMIIGAVGGGTVYVTVGATEQGHGNLIAFDAGTGDVKWNVGTKWHSGRNVSDGGGLVVAGDVIHYFLRKEPPSENETAVEYELITRATETGKLLDRRAVPDVAAAEGTLQSDFPVPVGKTLYVNYEGANGRGKTLVALRCEPDESDDGASGDDSQSDGSGNDSDGDDGDDC